MKIYIEKNQKLFAFFLLSFSMVCTIFTFAQVFSKAGFYEADGKVSHDFLGAIYLSIVTWTTLGYGDLRPTESVRIFAGIEALTGYLYLGLFVAFVINYLFMAQRGKKDNAET
ncbi:MAG: ion channel [Syntrophorhabdaceae bacterium]|nr:ion channel [Syntrophorhabdaceae bacterium]MDD5243689.1 ion channel [Syntrophorhabdaceae bacterium]